MYRCNCKLQILRKQGNGERMKKKDCMIYAEEAKAMNPIDDNFFVKMAEDIGFCEELLQTVLKDKELKVLTVTPQAMIKNLQGRSVILDAHCILSNGKHINIEVQKADDDNHQKRVRYNGACLTANITDPGVKFEKVPDVTIVYITKNDIFNKGKVLYHIDRTIRGTDCVLDNGFKEIYVNAKVKDDTDVSELMTIFTENKAYNDKKFPRISARKRYFKETPEGVKIMCQIIQSIVEKENEIVSNEEKLNSIKDALELLRVQNPQISLMEFFDYLSKKERFKDIGKEIIEEIFYE